MSEPHRFGTLTSQIFPQKLKAFSIGGLNIIRQFERLD